MKNYYEVLGLQKNCSAEDIKNSFIKLSKLYHPDVNKSENAHKKFIQVNEAYSVLGKNESRIKYDSGLLHRDIPKYSTYGSYENRVHMTQFDYMHFRNMQNAYVRGQYNPNNILSRKIGVAIFCCFLVVVGTGMQIIRQANYRRKRSMETAMAYEQSKARGKKLGREQAILNFHNLVSEAKMNEQHKAFEKDKIVEK